LAFRPFWAHWPIGPFWPFLQKLVKFNDKQLFCKQARLGQLRLKAVFDVNEKIALQNNLAYCLLQAIFNSL
jgi:hypothetical protein